MFVTLHIIKLYNNAHAKFYKIRGRLIKRRKEE
jgi:hypothetical protein